MVFKIITIVGSMRFTDQMFEQQIRLSKQGNVVLLPVMSPVNNEPNLTFDEKEIYSQLHFQKISMADEVFVVNLGGYIGPSTAREIEFAKNIKKPVHYMEPCS